MSEAALARKSMMEKRRGRIQIMTKKGKTAELNSRMRKHIQSPFCPKLTSVPHTLSIAKHSILFLKQRSHTNQSCTSNEAQESAQTRWREPTG